jgi:hypothetical protein
VSRCSKRKSLRCLCTLVGWLHRDQSSDITSTVCSFCLEFKMKLCWACRAVSVLMAMNTIDDSFEKESMRNPGCVWMRDHAPGYLPMPINKFPSNHVE